MIISETARTWLQNEWAFKNPIYMDIQTAWEIFKLVPNNQNAKEVWENYSEAKNLPDYNECVNKIKSQEDLVSWVYVKRLRW